MLLSGKVLFYGTVKELGKVVTEYVDVENKWFPVVDFAIIDGEKVEAEKMNLERIQKEASEWYGIRKIDSGFNSENLELVANYYGGGCGEYTEIMSDDDVDVEIGSLIWEILTNYVYYPESKANDVMLFAEIEILTANH
jgi:hypothetical protein